MIPRFFKTVCLSISIVILLPLASISQPGQGSQRGQAGGTPPAIGKLHGTLVDKNTGEPLMFASVVLKNQSDSSMVTGSITNELGRFEMEQLPPGAFFVSINYVGYPEQNFNSIRITFREPEFDMGTIEMEATASLLDEVTVESTRSLMETGLDRRVINVGQELTAIGGTGLDIMRNIPSVAVDFDGNVSLRGSTNVTILIDGRPSTLTGLSGSEAIEQIPAEMIERVEVITNPSARFNPEGTSGIINVVLKKQHRPGYNGMASLNAGTANRYNGSLNFNYNVNNWNFFSNFSGRLSSEDEFETSLRETTIGGLSNFMDQDMVSTEGTNSYNAQVGVDYRFNPNNTLTFSTRYNNRDRTSDDVTQYLLGQSLVSPSTLFKMGNDNSMVHNSFTHQLNFRRTYDQRLRELIADIAFSTRTMNRSENFLQQFYEQNFDTPNGRRIRERSLLDGNNWSFTTQLDYIHPLSETSKLETGFRTQIRELDSKFVFENESQSQQWILNDNRSNHFVYNEQIFAVYGMYATMLGKYSLQAGLRAEQTFTEGDQRIEGYEIGRNDYLSLFPTLHIRRDFENNQAVQVSYSRRINRPDNRNLNPFMQFNSDFDVSNGNPFLKPEFINSYEIGYTRYWDVTSVNPSLFYRHTEGMMTRFRDVREIDGREVTVTTFENLNQGISYGAEFIVSQSISSWWNVNGTFSYFRNIIQGARMEQENDNYSWSGRLVSNMNFGKGWNLQVNGFYRSPIIMLQGEMDAMYSASAGIRKNVLGNNGTISLNMNDIFNTMRYSMYNYGDNFTMNMEQRETSRFLNIGFTYRINEYNRRNERRDSMQDDNGDRMMDFD